MQDELGGAVGELPGLVWTAAPNGQIDFLNQRWREYTGMALADLHGRGWQARVHPEDLPGLLAGWRSVPVSSGPIEAEVRLRGADGEYRWFLFLAHHSLDAAGQFIKWSGFSTDINNRKRAEEELRESAARFRDYAETASDWLWEIGTDYNYTLLTENAFGSDPADRIGTKCWDHALDFETEPEKWRLVLETLDTRQPFRDFVFCTADGTGSPMYVKASGKPVFDAAGEFSGYRGTGSDLTAIIRAERAEASLRTAQADLAHMSRVTTLGQLTASIAHELTQPIAAALLNAETALSCLTRKPPNIVHATEAINRFVNDGMRATDIIERTRALVKKAPARKDNLEINLAISEIVGLTRSEVSKNGVQLDIRLADGLPAVQGDRVQLQQVMLNLIMNAVESMSQMSDHRRELLITTEPEEDCVLVAVRDSGPGLPELALERAFEAFYTTKSTGLGMGLSICRSIVEAHGGRLWAAANFPKGAAFQFTVPVISGPGTVPSP
ncbi:ATP-binding protein [Mesorhizobium sp. M0152]|uniref:PAS domain-containing sensor histidine kinase n=1 Tax=Mesorhizobium sp. M0152 TaxID=2956898 RepID=UPI00333CE43E